MKRRARSFLRFAGIATVAAAGLFAAGSPAFAATVPTGAATGTASPSAKNDPWTFTWTDSTPNVPGAAVTYEAGFAATAGDAPATPTAASSATVQLLPPEGTSYFRVRALEDGVPASGYGDAVQVVADRTGPTASGTTLSGTVGVNNWYRGTSVTVNPVGCTDAVAGGCVAPPWTIEGDFHSTPAQTTISDVLGNQSPLTITQAFGFDKTKPVSGIPFAPGALVADEPQFEWTPGSDSVSAVDHYDVVYTKTADFQDDYNPTGGTTIASKDDLGGVGNYTATRGQGVAPLPVNTPLKWWIRTTDKAGNVKLSDAFNLTIDPTVPPAPTITSGPNAPTSDPSPTFTWTGAETNFHWEVTLVGSQNPARQGGGNNVTQTTLASLPDGDYTFRVTQITEAGKGSAEAIRSFKIDTTPPAPPVITARPTFPAIGAAPIYAWTTEPGAFSRWSILDAGGNLIYGPIETPVTTAELPPLADGPYTFQVVQIDAAGNVSQAVSEGFTVLAPLVAPTPEDNARTALLAALPKQNALRLQPKAGTILPTLQPVLRWKKGPRGTKLYNLQIFQVTPRKGNARPKVKKVLSRFPRGLQFRAPKRQLKAGTCYVWRVWPYTGTAFTTRPVGVSNFCIAGKKVLRAKAAKAAARRAAIRARS